MGCRHFLLTRKAYQYIYDEYAGINIVILSAGSFS